MKFLESQSHLTTPQHTAERYLPGPIVDNNIFNNNNNNNNMYVFVCVCVYIYIYIYIYMYVCMYVCRPMCMCVCLNVYVYVCIYVLMHACIYVCCIHVFVSVHFDTVRVPYTSNLTMF